MKRKIWTALILAGALCACTELPPVNKPEEPSQEQEEEPGLPEIEDNTNPSLISAEIPDAIGTRVSVSGVESGGAALAWEAGDCLRIIGTPGQAELFSIVEEGMLPNKAGFKGNPVAGDSFTVIYPGTYSGIAELNTRSYTGQVQDGNGSTAHLQWNAVLSGLDSYASVLFASGGDAEYKCNGVVRFRFDVPERYESISKIALTAPEAVFHTTNDPDGPLAGSLELELQNIDLSQSRSLDAYLMVSWNEVTFAEGDSYTLTITGTGGASENVEKTAPAGGLTIGGGQVTLISLDASDLQEPLFWAGDGKSAATAYEIKTVKHLQNMNELIVSHAGASTLYFKLIDDLDMDGVDWAYKNNSISNNYPVDFNGDGHTIGNFSMTRYSASLFGALKGSVYDLKFKNAAIATGTASAARGGLLAFRAGAEGHEAVIRNITVDGLSVKGTTQDVGGLVGQLTNGTIADCTVTGLSIESGGAAGGLVGRVADASCSITGCSVEGSVTSTGAGVGGIVGVCSGTTDITISGSTFSGSVSADGKYAAGILSGNGTDSDETGAYTITNCHSTADITASQYAAGILAGNNNASTKVSLCTASGSITCTSTTAGANMGGIVGRSNSDIEITSCSSSASVTGRNQLGGIVGAASGTVELCKCTGTIKATITASGNAESYTGGIVGFASNNKQLTVSQCYYNGSIEGSDHMTAAGGIVGEQYGSSSLTIENCCSIGNIGNDTSRPRAYIGGLLGQAKDGTVKVENSYSAMSIIAGQGSVNGLGGLIGGSASKKTNWVVEKCLAWNEKIEFTMNESLAYDGVILGQANDNSPTGTASLKNCWYRYDLSYTKKPANRTPGDSEDLTASPGKARYDGHRAGEGVSCSAQATALGWNEAVWNLSGDVPELINVR